MPSLQVRDVPDHIYRRLTEQAERERRSLAQQTIAVLARGLDVEIDPKVRRAKVLETIRSRGRRAETAKFSDPVKLIREDRQR